MRIALMGASGLVGSKILVEALNRGHTVAAVSRTPEKLPQHLNLRPIKADVFDVAALTNCFRGQGAIIHSYAPPSDPDVRACIFAAIQAGDDLLATVSRYVPHDLATHDARVRERVQLQTLGTRCVIDAVKAAGVKRILAVGGAGTLLKDGVRFIDHPDMPKAFEGGAKSTAVVKELLHHEAEIEWTSLSPSYMLVPGERTGKFRLGLDELLVTPDGSSSISLEDYAMAMIDELEFPRHTGRRFTVGY